MVAFLSTPEMLTSHAALPQISMRWYIHVSTVHCRLTDGAGEPPSGQPLPDIQDETTPDILVKASQIVQVYARVLERMMTTSTKFIVQLPLKRLLAVICQLMTVSPESVVSCPHSYVRVWWGSGRRRDGSAMICCTGLQTTEPGVAGGERRADVCPPRDHRAAHVDYQEVTVRACTRLPPAICCH